jgi:hypothetical protein
MTYDNFIGEIRSIVDRARDLFDADELEENKDFKRWKKELVSLILAIEDSGYNPRCDVISREFTLFADYGSIPSDAQLRKAFNDDLQDTIDELEIIVNSYDKYGGPNNNIVKSTPAELDYPEKVTIMWLARHMPAKLLITAIVLLASAFLLGVKFGNTDLYRSLNPAALEYAAEHQKG